MKNFIFTFFQIVTGALLLFAVPAKVQAQTTRYLKPTATGSGDGSSWANASSNLQGMIDASAAGDAVWVAAGTYKPAAYPTGCTGCGTTRDYAFGIKNGVKLYGGFAGTETALSQRAITANATILSGDIGSTGVSTDNCYHVVVSAPDPYAAGFIGITLDGFTITGGNANGGNNTSINFNSIGQYNGAGIYIMYGTNTITNNTLLANAATSGGGIYTDRGENTLTINTFSGNSATYGGGIYTYLGSHTLANNAFSGNTASNAGGGVFAASSTNSLANNTLLANTATSNGGGIFTSGGTNTLINNLFWANTQGGSSTVQGADYYRSPSSDNTFTHNLLQLASANYSTTGSGNYDIGTGASGNLFNTNPSFVNTSDIDGADNRHRTADDGLFLQSNSPCLNTGTATNAPATDILGTTRAQQGAGVDMGAYEYLSALYVDASVSASGNGTGWSTAYKTLPEALTAAHCNTVIKTVHVATGIYKPTKKSYNSCTEITTSSPRDVTFHVRDGLALYGGYPAGGGTRNVATHVTTLSGDIGTAGVSTDNCFHVVIASASTGVTIDGFTISDGRADGSNSIVVNSQTISPQHGGGIYITYGTNTLANNTISANTANYAAGGVYLENNTNTFTNNTISGNSAPYRGGGVYTYNGTHTLTNNTFVGNSCSDANGGGICADYGTNTLANNIFAGNTAINGGGAFLYACANSKLTNNVLAGNTATSGGGVYIAYGANTLTNNTFSGNTASANGGGIYTDGGTTSFTNNLLWGNKKGASTTSAGADYYATGTNNNTFTYNLLQLASGNYPVSTATNYGIGTGATGNLFATDPQFVNAADIDGTDNLYRTADDGLRLQTGSPFINAGDPAVVAPATDLAGTARAGAFDLGAYEFSCPAATTLYADAGKVSSGDGQSWATAYKTLSEALAVAQYCSSVATVEVATGIYLPTEKPFNNGAERITTDARDVTFHLRDGLTLRGGYPAGGGTRNITAHVTTLSGDIGTASVSTDNAYHVVLASAASGAGVGVTIDGFTLTGGNANGFGNVSANGNPIYRGTGGGMYADRGSNALTNNTFSANMASSAGGFAAFNSTNTLTGNTFSANVAASGNGGGIYTDASTNTFTANTFANNAASGNGGGIYTYDADNTFGNNLFSGNTATSGGGIYFYVASGYHPNTLTNNTFWGNLVTGDGGGFATDNATNTLFNNIFWNNKKNNNSGVQGADFIAYTSNTFTNNLLQLVSTNYSGYYDLGAGATGNLFATDPQFVNVGDIDGADNLYRTADDGLRLQATSPARNMGLNSAVAALPRDLMGNTRTFGGAVDMGAYQQFDLAAFTAVTGTSQAVAADGQYTDATGWTHYVNDATDKYILSIKKNGNDIGTIGDGTFTVTASTTSTWGATTAAAITAPYATNTGWKVMNRWWKVTPTTQPASNVQVRTYYTATDLAGLRVATGDNALTHPQLKFYKINGAGTNPDPSTGHGSIAVAANYSANGYWEYNNGPAATTTTWAAGTIGSDFYGEYTVASFSGGGGGGSLGGGNSNPLFPVEWLSFEATPAAETVTLDWVTASEQNNAAFTAERSLNGVDFEAIGAVAAIGNSTSPTAYTLTDSDLPATTLHYRIRQTDMDGHSSHSEIRTVTLDRASGLAVWPNPATHELSVTVPANVYFITLSDAAGREFRAISTDGQLGTISLDLSDLATGVYTLRAGTATVRVVKE